MGRGGSEQNADATPRSRLVEAAERWPEAPDSAPLPDGMRVNIYETSALLEVPIVEEYGDRSADRWLNADELRAIAERLNWAADRLDQR